jgi:hypothetical protein
VNILHGSESKIYFPSLTPFKSYIYEKLEIAGGLDNIITHPDV